MPRPNDGKVADNGVFNLNDAPIDFCTNVFWFRSFHKKATSSEMRMAIGQDHTSFVGTRSTCELHPVPKTPS
jgi:hypothetical protein